MDAGDEASTLLQDGLATLEERCVKDAGRFNAFTAHARILYNDVFDEHIRRRQLSTISRRTTSCADTCAWTSASRRAWM